MGKVLFAVCCHVGTKCKVGITMRSTVRMSSGRPCLSAKCVVTGLKMDQACRMTLSRLDLFETLLPGCELL